MKWVLSWIFFMFFSPLLSHLICLKRDCFGWFSNLKSSFYSLGNSTLLWHITWFINCEILLLIFIKNIFLFMGDLFVNFYVVSFYVLFLMLFWPHKMSCMILLFIFSKRIYIQLGLFLLWNNSILRFSLLEICWLCI